MAMLWFLGTYNTATSGPLPNAASEDLHRHVFLGIVPAEPKPPSCDATLEYYP